MESESGHKAVRDTLIRMVAVVLATTAFGFLFFRFGVFNTKMAASQFLESGVTAAIFYAALKSLRLRDGIIGLVVWYIVLTFFVGDYAPWLPVRYLGYVGGIAGAVYVYILFVRRDILKGGVQRVAGAGVLTAIANACIVLFLGLFTFRVAFSSVGFFASTVFKSLQIGTLIGIGFGFGAEVAEYLIRKLEGTKPGHPEETPPNQQAKAD